MARASAQAECLNRNDMDETEQSLTVSIPQAIQDVESPMITTKMALSLHMLYQTSCPGQRPGKRWMQMEMEEAKSAVLA